VLHQIFQSIFVRDVEVSEHNSGAVLARNLCDLSDAVPAIAATQMFPFRRWPMTLHKCYAGNVRRHNVTVLVERDEALLSGGPCSNDHGFLPRAAGKAPPQLDAVDGHVLLGAVAC